MHRLVFLWLLTLVACAAGQNAGDVKAASASAPNTASTEAAATTANAIDYSCKTDNDCKIKDVGSCCGYRPACVNENSPTYPAEVKAQCGKKGMSSICGFPTVTSCVCSNSICEGTQNAASQEKLQ